MCTCTHTGFVNRCKILAAVAGPELLLLTDADGHTALDVAKAQRAKLRPDMAAAEVKRYDDIISILQRQ